MSISDRNRKILWGKSGNRCAMCKHTLVFESTDADSESIVGEECHIVSRAKSGPRSDVNFSRENLDNVSNLILLCRIHHKKIDDQVETYTLEQLFSIKKKHENWVESKLKNSPENTNVRIQRSKKEIPKKLSIVNSGKEMFNIAAGACGFYYDYSDSLTEEELDLVGSFIQNVQDWSEISGELELIHQIDAAKNLDRGLKALREINFFVFAAIENQKLVGGISGESPFPVLHLSVQRASDSNIVTK